MLHTVNKEIFILVLFLLLPPLFSADEFNNGRILMYQIISRLTQLCLGEKKTGQNHFQLKNISMYTVDHDVKIVAIRLCRCIWIFHLIKNL